MEIPKINWWFLPACPEAENPVWLLTPFFAEGQRRYIESLSPYARQFLGQMDRRTWTRLPTFAGYRHRPALSSHNPRSTVGTLTEIYDYLRILYARLGEVFCPIDGVRIHKLSPEEMVNIIMDKAKELKERMVTILSPAVRGRKGEYYQLLYDVLALDSAKPE